MEFVYNKLSKKIAGIAISLEKKIYFLDSLKEHVQIFSDLFKSEKDFQFKQNKEMTTTNDNRNIEIIDSIFEYSYKKGFMRISLQKNNKNIFIYIELSNFSNKNKEIISDLFAAIVKFIKSKNKESFFSTLKKRGYVFVMDNDNDINLKFIKDLSIQSSVFIGLNAFRPIKIIEVSIEDISNDRLFYF